MTVNQGWLPQVLNLSAAPTRGFAVGNLALPLLYLLAGKRPAARPETITSAKQCWPAIHGVRHVRNLQTEEEFHGISSNQFVVPGSSVSQ
jgi:hypothetical protein